MVGLGVRGQSGGHSKVGQSVEGLKRPTGKVRNNSAWR